MPTTRVKKVLQAAKGFYGRAKNCYRIAKPRVNKAMQYQYISRKLRKRENRREWLLQVNAASRQHGVPYSFFTHGLIGLNIALNKKILAELAQREPVTFQALVESVKKHDREGLASKSRRAPQQMALQFGLLSSTLGRSPTAQLTNRPADPHPGLLLGDFYASMDE